MRTIVNISMPQGLYDEVETIMKSGQYASKSEFFRELLRTWKMQQLQKDIAESEEDIAKGRVIRGKSLKHFRVRHHDRNSLH
jgi:Arc/MetJ-type ribon-helix-helix transcriptional regulator